MLLEDANGEGKGTKQDTYMGRRELLSLSPQSPSRGSELSQQKGTLMECVCNPEKPIAQLYKLELRCFTGSRTMFPRCTWGLFHESGVHAHANPQRDMTIGRRTCFVEECLAYLLKRPKQ